MEESGRRCFDGTLHFAEQCHNAGGSTGGACQNVIVPFLEWKKGDCTMHRRRGMVACAGRLRCSILQVHGNCWWEGSSSPILLVEMTSTAGVTNGDKVAGHIGAVELADMDTINMFESLHGEKAVASSVSITPPRIAA